MELLFQEQSIQFHENLTAEQIIEQINLWLNDTYYFSHLVADSVDIYEDPEQYLDGHLNNINKLEIIARTAAEFTNDILLSAENYLNNTSEELENLSESFYKNPSNETWQKFSDMLEGMQWLNQIIISIDQMKEKPQNWDEFLKLAATLEVELKNMEEAIGNHDYILIGDIIQYEIVPLYESLKKEIQTTIDNEGMRHDVN